MISKEDMDKIVDFRETYRKIINKDNDKFVNEIVDAIFFNVRCMYEEFYQSIGFINEKAEPYKFHILQPKNGKYSLLDFLINRAISNIDAIDIGNYNGYTHHKLLSINSSRYKKDKQYYSDAQIKALRLKDMLHESGHAIYKREITNSSGDYPRCSSEHNKISYPNAHIIDFKEKVCGFETILSNKYDNLLHTSTIPHNVEICRADDATCICQNVNFDEAFTEYYATKYSTTYEDETIYRAYKMTLRSENGKLPIIFTPNATNGYAHFSKFIYHLDNLVSKESMFKTTFMGTNTAFRELSEKYSDIINDFWKKNNLPKEFTSPIAKLKFLLDNTFLELCEYSEEFNKKLTKYHYLLDSLFSEIYKSELVNGTIAKEKMKTILRFSSFMAPAAYNTINGEITPTQIKKWYEEQYRMLSQTISVQKLGEQARECIENTLLTDEYYSVIGKERQRILQHIII